MISTLAVLVGCGNSENVANTKKWQSTAKKKAVEFIKEKYGIDAEVVGIRSAKGSSDFLSFPDNTPCTYVSMTANGKNFVVETRGDVEDNDETKDNFQQEEICQAVREVVEELSQFEVKYVDVYYRTPYSSQKFLAHDKYEVFPNASAQEKADAINKVFNKQYSHNKGDASQGYSTVVIRVCFIGNDLDAMAEETRYLEQDVFKIELVDLFEVACKDDKSLCEVEKIFDGTLYVASTAEEYLNGYTKYDKQANYLGKVVVKDCIHSSLD